MQYFIKCSLFNLVFPNEDDLKRTCNYVEKILQSEDRKLSDFGFISALGLLVSIMQHYPSSVNKNSDIIDIAIEDVTRLLLSGQVQTCGSHQERMKPFVFQSFCSSPDIIMVLKNSEIFSIQQYLNSEWAQLLDENVDESELENLLEYTLLFHHYFRTVTRRTLSTFIGMDLVEIPPVEACRENQRCLIDFLWSLSIHVRLMMY